MEHLSEDEFVELRKKYEEENNRYKKSLCFHVGTQAGFYSEINCMLQCMCWCHLNEVKFTLYADDANFALRGWNDLFDSFCEESHDSLNKIANYRAHPRWEWKPKFIRHFITYAIRSRLLKGRNHLNYITSDIFQEIISPEFKNTHIKWDIFNMDGTIYPEISKLHSFAARFNTYVREEIDEMKKSLNLPQDYVSVQIRGGDKIIETEPIGVAEVLKVMNQSGVSIHNVFVFTDDFRNIEYLKEHTEWNIYYLTKEDERGYVNGDFVATGWDNRKKELIKLFAMVECCIDSKFHFGYETSNPSEYIKVCKKENEYFPLHNDSPV